MSVTPPSSWPWLDHPVSGLRPPTQSPCSDSLSLRLPYTVKLAGERKSLTHYTKGTPSSQLEWFSTSSSLPSFSSGLLDGRFFCRAARGERLSCLNPARRSVQDHCKVGPFAALRAAKEPAPLKAIQAGTPTVCMHAVSGSIALPFRGSFRLSLTVLVHYRSITSI